MKIRITALLLALMMILLVFAACGGSSSDKDDTKEDSSASSDNSAEETSSTDDHTIENVGHPLYIRAVADCDEIYATFSSANGGDSREVDLNKVEDDADGSTAVYCCYADPMEFDRVTVTVNGSESVPIAFNNYTEGWELFPENTVPFLLKREKKTPTFERKSFPYQDRTKDVLIWTPADYDANASEKYSVIYMTDGQNLYDPGATATGCWAVAESAEAMMNNSKNKVIVVGVENYDDYRDDELTPDLGTPTDPSYADGHGADFCDFVVNTVAPYVEQNYNIYTDRDHTAVCGSSSGGIESFYIAMEHPEKFGAVGALSPAFSLFDDATWKKYLGTKYFSAGYPRVYIYNGGGDLLESELLVGAQSMPENLMSINYPAQNIYTTYNEDAKHNELFWRVIFPDFLKYTFI